MIQRDLIGEVMSHTVYYMVYLLVIAEMIRSVQLAW